MTTFRNLFLCLLLTAGLVAQAAGLSVDASRALIKRIVPAHADKFIVEPLTDNNGKDGFELSSRGNKIVLAGNDGVAVASALYYYLNEYCHCQITWNGVNMNLPAQLPKVDKKITKSSPYDYRNYLNYCTYNYSMSWWDWNRWEKEIDWMALHGINMPLAITGEEYVWNEVYKEMGFTSKELENFFCGPAYFSWFWMGNLDGWGGPLPQSWMNRQKDLQLKILQRERELGMKPVLSAFTGHVPAAFKERFPNAKLKQTNWNNGFADTYILDAEDPLFAEIGKKYLQKQTALFGTDHLYSADTFNENEPPSNEPEFLSKLSARVYEGMRQADPEAVWVMQGWLFFSDRKFWNAPQVKALLDAVPNDKMILLDLITEYEPVWKRTEAYYGKPWIWNMLHNFGGNISLFGQMERVASQPAAALADKNAGKLKGIGLTMEAIEQTPVLYELMMENTWRTSAIDLDQWLKSYIRNRYGKGTVASNADMFKAWQVLKSTVYNGKDIRDGAESILTGRPTFDSATVWTKTRLNYKRADLIPAWDLFVKTADVYKNSDGFRYDLVDLTRQVLANYARTLQVKWIKAYQDRDQVAFKRYSDTYLELISDMDRLLATRSDFLLGKWLADARSCGTTESEKALYERNARDLITLWGDADSPLHEYSCRQWSGLLNDFYKVRWQKFFAETEKAMAAGKEMDVKAFGKEISQWEWQWVNQHKDFPTQVSGNSVLEAQRLYKKYRNQLINQ
ncbi:alpha-N-acetylglucosaminidase [Paludibacter jiangxiensis]|uniref:Alpha-N-acetylglucosaminidase n=1 Tax=Paludibacter jiangxiensis TaxID=681398 RepID=A0A161LFQ9_9BACT|nr:alpha-N-acetylglucosaminidase [Paludibacter jiangxiensis]GAT64015.1 alpha-N-acetylglucosaminidase [Paludibacter jiangxiensis]